MVIPGYRARQPTFARVAIPHRRYMTGTDRNLSIEMVARKAKVSTATVSRTINNVGNVRTETAKRVWDAVRALQYHPNAYARTLGSGRSRILGLIISDICNPFFPDLIKSFEDAALACGYEVLLTNTNYDPGRMARCAQRMIERRVEGVAVMTSEMDRQILAELASRAIPVACLDSAIPGDRISNIRVQYPHGIAEAIAYLYRLGHRRIGFLSGPANLRSARVRRSAFLKALRKHDIQVEPELIQEGDHKIGGGEATVQKLLVLPRPPSAILASNDLTAIGALRAIQQRGLRVPGDISLIGFDDIELSQLTTPPLTTIQLSRTELGEKAFHALFKLLQNKSQQGKEYRIETHLVVRQSTDQAPAQRAAAK